jgi:hypothetical protein
VNDVASFDKAGYKMLRPSGRKGPVRGRLIDEMKFVTKDAIAYSGTGWKKQRGGRRGTVHSDWAP